MPTNDAQSCVCKVSRFKPGEVGRQNNGFSIGEVPPGRYRRNKDIFRQAHPVKKPDAPFRRGEYNAAMYRKCPGS